MTLIEAEGVAVRYDTSDGWVGGGLDLDVSVGEVVLLLGPSGCGKSTLALTLNGLVPHSVPAELRGTVRVAGRDTAHHPPGRLCDVVGMVFQDPDAQIVCETLLDEVCFGLENLLTPRAEIEPRAMAVLAEVGLADTLELALRDPTRLSGGERQKLALACALAPRPSVLVLDEPTANLDPRSTRDFYHLLGRVAERGTSVILIEHDLDDAVVVADRVVVLDAEGNVRLTGTPAEVLAGRADELDALGVYGPTAVQAARRLGLYGDTPRDAPLTLEGLASVLRDEAVTDLSWGPVDEQDAQSSPTEIMATTLVEVDDLTVRLGDADVLRGVSLSVARGAYLAVIGLNGAGKSTLAGCLAGVLRPPPGRVRIDGADISRFSARELSDRVGYVFQNPEHQFVTGSVAEELAHGLFVRGLPGAEVTARVARMLERFDLARYKDVNPFMLSHGEKRRLSVATALICGPELLVLDEPTFGQDRARAGELLTLLDALHTAGTTVIIVTHDLQLVAEHATHVAVLAAGGLLAHAPVERVLRDDALLERAGLLPPPVRRLATALAPGRPRWETVFRLTDLSPRLP
ncbi:ABC transporter ATP-binding protein [Nonomuraea diastatica]|uniref:ABC transporter ATP-binding protein n=1 Tax=Nonomuraea diastatica TaxID=1848329 RepID=A0A4R4WMS5_9ACTN|nr:ABC transporter ATP-binding protein [Nonomuraea diastatica]TDD18947.1 ABC transporter ATP-binding protein [Nonomuraea diastatica]